MNKNLICEAVYASHGDVVVRRRKSLVSPLFLLLSGVAALAANTVWADVLSANLSSSLVFVAIFLLVAGVILLAVRVFDKTGRPYHKKLNSYLRYEEVFFDSADGDAVRAAVNGGDVQRLLDIPRSNIPTLAVAVYRSQDGRFSAMQIFTYSDFEYHEASELVITDK